jgi:hypothetical protein
MSPQPPKGGSRKGLRVRKSPLEDLGLKDSLFQSIGIGSQKRLLFGKAATYIWKGL